MFQIFQIIYNSQEYIIHFITQKNTDYIIDMDEKNTDYIIEIRN
jgi:hypothetical protein